MLWNTTSDNYVESEAAVLRGTANFIFKRVGLRKKKEEYRLEVDYYITEEKNSVCYRRLVSGLSAYQGYGWLERTPGSSSTGGVKIRQVAFVIDFPGECHVGRKVSISSLKLHLPVKTHTHTNCRNSRD